MADSVSLNFAEITAGLLGIAERSTGHALDVCLRRETCPGLTRHLLTRIAELEALAANRLRECEQYVAQIKDVFSYDWMDRAAKAEAERDALRELLREVERTEREESPSYDAAGRRLCRWCGDYIDHARFGNTCTMVRIRAALGEKEGE